MPLTSVSAALCGALAGGISGALTCPLDVLNTRTILADAGSMQSTSIYHTFRMIWNDRGIPGLFAGVIPRAVWISMGGFIFFGVYDLATRTLKAFFSK